MNRAFQIQQICNERDITTPVHFTGVENLQSILHRGLLGRSVLEENRLPFLFSDNIRLDGHKEAVCLSISFPNYGMFYKVRQTLSDHHWIVLLIDAKVLWELDCLFCTENAAAATIRGKSLGEKREPDMLKAMFEGGYTDKQGTLVRRSAQIPKNYPTHPQAEVLVLDPIPAENILSVHFDNNEVLETWYNNNTWVDPSKLCFDQQYFLYRVDYQQWQS